MKNNHHLDVHLEHERHEKDSPELLNQRNRLLLFLFFILLFVVVSSMYGFLNFGKFFENRKFLFGSSQKWNGTPESVTMRRKCMYCPNFLATFVSLNPKNAQIYFILFLPVLAQVMPNTFVDFASFRILPQTVLKRIFKIILEFGIKFDSKRQVINCCL